MISHDLSHLSCFPDAAAVNGDYFQLNHVKTKVLFKRVCRSREAATYHEEEPDAHHLGRPLHVVMSQSSSLDQLLGDDIADTD